MIALPLYLICLAIELVYVFVRFVVAAMVAAALGYDTDAAVLISLAVAVFPLVWSISDVLGHPRRVGSDVGERRQTTKHEGQSHRRAGPRRTASARSTSPLAVARDRRPDPECPSDRSHDLRQLRPDRRTPRWRRCSLMSPATSVHSAATCSSPSSDSRCPGCVPSGPTSM